MVAAMPSTVIGTGAAWRPLINQSCYGLERAKAQDKTDKLQAKVGSNPLHRRYPQRNKLVEPEPDFTTPGNLLAVYRRGKAAVTVTEHQGEWQGRTIVEGRSPIDDGKIRVTVAVEISHLAMGRILGDLELGRIEGAPRVEQGRVDLGWCHRSGQSDNRDGCCDSKFVHAPRSKSVARIGMLPICL